MSPPADSGGNTDIVKQAEPQQVEGGQGAEEHVMTSEEDSETNVVF